MLDYREGRLEWIHRAHVPPMLDREVVEHEQFVGIFRDFLGLFRIFGRIGCDELIVGNYRNGARSVQYLHERSLALGSAATSVRH
ncbi:hypothetical protein ABIC51_008200 [Burkholderia sp. 572]